MKRDGDTVLRRCGASYWNHIEWVIGLWPIGENYPTRISMTGFLGPTDAFRKTMTVARYFYLNKFYLFFLLQKVETLFDILYVPGYTVHCYDTSVLIIQQVFWRTITALLLRHSYILMSHRTISIFIGDHFSHAEHRFHVQIHIYTLQLVLNYF